MQPAGRWPSRDEDHAEDTAPRVGVVLGSLPRRLPTPATPPRDARRPTAPAIGRVDDRSPDRARMTHPRTAPKV